MRFRPSEIKALSLPTTASNRRNARNNPIIELGSCTASQLISRIGLPRSIGLTCVVGNPARGIGVAKALSRRSGKPFLFVGAPKDKNSAFTALEPDWTIDSAAQSLPSGNGAIFLSKAQSAVELCACFEEWSREHFVILHLGSGLQMGPELLEIMNGEECLIFCDSIANSLRGSDTRTLTVKDFLSRMQCIVMFSAESSIGDVVDFLPTYQYEHVTNTLNFSGYRSRMHIPFSPKNNSRGLSWSQSRTLDLKKNVIETDELQLRFDNGSAMVFCARTNSVYLAQIE